MLLPLSCKRKRGKALGAILWLEPKDYSFQSAAGANGNGMVAELDGRYASLCLQVAGTFTATVTFEASQDGTNYIAVQGTIKNSGSAATTATAAGLFEFRVVGVRKFRVPVSGYASGAITVTATASPMAL